MLKTFENDYGERTLVKFNDAEGNVLVWWASGCPKWLERDKTFNCKGTVVKHEDYQGELQTKINRVKNEGEVT